MQTRTLTEHVADWHAGLTVDRTRRTVRNVALTGLTSKNGYRYTEQALRDAARLYEHKPVFLDHAGDKSRPHERSTRDLVGTIVSPRYETGRLRGDVRVLDTDSGRTFLALSESDAPGVGMSHVVVVERTSEDGAVERIRDVVSVDAVVFPATTTTFRESTQTAKATAHTQIESAPEPTADETPTPETVLHHRVQELLTERDALRDRLQALRDRASTAARERRLQFELAQADLPSFAITESFRGLLLSTHAADDRARLIAERKQLIDEARRVAPISTERSVAGAIVNENASFVATVKRRTL